MDRCRIWARSTLQSGCETDARLVLAQAGSALRSPGRATHHRLAAGSAACTCRTRERGREPGCRRSVPASSLGAGHQEHPCEVCQLTCT